jgi:hypothetical protein
MACHPDIVSCPAACYSRQGSKSQICVVYRAFQALFSWSLFRTRTMLRGRLPVVRSGSPGCAMPVRSLFSFLLNRPLMSGGEYLYPGKYTPGGPTAGEAALVATEEWASGRTWRAPFVSLLITAAASPQSRPATKRFPKGSVGDATAVLGHDEGVAGIHSPTTSNAGKTWRRFGGLLVYPSVLGFIIVAFYPPTLPLRALQIGIATYDRYAYGSFPHRARLPVVECRLTNVLSAAEGSSHIRWCEPHNSIHPRRHGCRALRAASSAIRSTSRSSMVVI